MQNKLLKDLWSVLQEEINVYKELYKLSEEENRLLVNNDLEAFQKVVQKQEKLILEIHTMDNVRQKVASTMTKELGDSSKAANIPDLFDSLEEGDKAKLKQLQGQVVQLKEKLDAINKTNGVLISNALQYLKFSHRISGGKPEKNPQGEVYSDLKEPKKKTPRKSSTIDTKI